MSSVTLREALIEKISGLAKQRLKAEVLAVYQQFLPQVIHPHPEETLLDWSAEELHGVFFGLFKFAQHRTHGEAGVSVVNPSVQADGWSCRHSVVYFTQRDMPFLVDSIRMALNRLQLDIHQFESNQVWLTRDAKGCLESFCDPDTKGATKEDLGFVLVTTNRNPEQQQNIQAELHSVLKDVNLVVDDFSVMLDAMDMIIGELEHVHQNYPDAKIDPEEILFLRWLRHNNFTFLGYACFQLGHEDNEVTIGELDDRRLGLMRHRALLPQIQLSKLSKGFGSMYESDINIAFTKSSVRSTVHRPVYSDYVIIKRYSEAGVVIGEHRFLGLYTSMLYHTSTDLIPLVRVKRDWLVEHSQLDVHGHTGKTFNAIIESHPRDDLIQSSRDELLATLLGVWKSYERRSVRLFLRTDPFEKFVSCLVFLPRDVMRTELRESIEDVLTNALGGELSEYETHFLPDSMLARIRYVFRIKKDVTHALDYALLQRKITELATDWEESFADLIHAQWGDEEAVALEKMHAGAFSKAYQNSHSPQLAISDLSYYHLLQDRQHIAMNFFRRADAERDVLQLKLYRRHEPIELSDMIPKLENLGFRVLVEHPYQISPAGADQVWMLEFTLRFSLNEDGALDVASVSHLFENAFMAVWEERAENDTFNRLVLGARLEWSSVALLRTIAHYLKQLGSLVSTAFVADVLVKHSDVARNLIALFRSRFDPRLAAREEQHGEREARLIEKISEARDGISNLNEDQIVKQYLDVILATTRTNYFAIDESKGLVPIALKIKTSELPFAPKPRPMFETYLYSTRLEGVHLRGGTVARGGLRWSDRYEDYRTEILGLVKAQQVKNAVIVPTGAKGGFVAKRAAQLSERSEFLAEGVACYKEYIAALLSLADNRVQGEVTSPENVVCLDGEDPYLVVAADKGTATFSDIANEIAEHEGFWLGDAFASGGSNGYDHKAMGITARGAWVAVQRHFRELNVDIQEQEFDVIGIGDMAGDVFGNGMLLSKTIRLVAAFNHKHIFIDPDPDAAESWTERSRLFTDSAGWEAYNLDIVSKGGGLFDRGAKSITISPQMAKCFDIKETKLTPTELIHRLLKAPVDLVWNGGIGTYVRATAESNEQVGDKANDQTRVTGSQLRCKVFGEGGNLGMTQRGRVEFCLAGGICNSDFVDNAAGVDCSDNEVNIKILLNEIVAADDLTKKQRNKLLVLMTDQVAAQVLKNNYRQTLSISLAMARLESSDHNYLRFMNELEAVGKLDPGLEYLPDTKTLQERERDQKSWVRPEISVLISYAKIELQEALLAENFGIETEFDVVISEYFPTQLAEQFSDAVLNHRLRKEIVCMRVANDLVDRMGLLFVYGLIETIGVNIAEVAKAYLIALKVLDLDRIWVELELLDNKVDSAVQYRSFLQLMRLGNRVTRSILRYNLAHQNEPLPVLLTETIKPTIDKLPSLQPAVWGARQKVAESELEEHGVPQATAQYICNLDAIFILAGFASAAIDTERDLEFVAEVGFNVCAILGLERLMRRVGQIIPGNFWQESARHAHLDSLESYTRKITSNVLAASSADSNDAAELVASWQYDNKRKIIRFAELVENVEREDIDELSVFTVIFRELDKF
jgi:glutamate dehydrogenase